MMLTVGKQSRKKRWADYVDSRTWMPDQFYYKLGNVNYIFSYTKFDNKRTSQQDFCTFVNSYGVYFKNSLEQDL